MQFPYPGIGTDASCHRCDIRAFVTFALVNKCTFYEIVSATISMIFCRVILNRDIFQGLGTEFL